MRRLWLGCVLAAVLGACGGGGGGGGGSVAEGGIGGTGISSGSITGFGSIFVTGTEYDISTAQVELDRRSASATDLRLGMVVVVEGDRAPGGLTGTATRVRFDDEIEGPVSAVTPISIDEIDLTILNQTVTLERTVAHFEGAATFGFDTIAVNDLVEVSGFRDQSGRIRATFVEKNGTFRPGDTPSVELKGTVAGRAGTTFLIGTVEVTFDGATELADLPTGEPQDGEFVEVEGTLTGPNEVLATRIESEGPFSGDRDDFEVEGLVGGFASLANFRVDGQPVDASGVGVVFEPANPGFVADGVRVEVEGTLRAGVVVAEKVKLREGEVRVHAEVASASDIDAVGGTFVLLGIEFRIDATTQIEDERDDVSDFDLDDVTAGDFLEVRGIDEGFGPVLATEIRREDSDDVSLRGRVEDFDPDQPGRSVTILGVVVPTNGDTEFDDFPVSIDNEDDFYDFVEIGDLLDVDDEDPIRTTIDFADAIDFGED